jgi:GDP-4-dehydro-6-deoxy-D-mannose reductase
MNSKPFVLVTGSNGFTGVHLVRYLLSLPVHVVGVGRRTSPVLQDNAFEYETCDLGNPAEAQRILQQVNPHYVIHLAAENNIPASWQEPAKTLQANALNTLHLLEAIRLQPASRLKRVLLIGSAQEYQAALLPKDHFLTEQSIVLPSNPYGWSKLLQTYLALMYARDFRLPIVIARPFNLIGPEASHGVCAQLGKQIVEMERGLRPPTLHVGNLNIERDFLDVRDAVQAYWSLLTNDFIQTTDIYNVCSGTSTAIGSLLTRFQALSHIRFEVKSDPSLFRTNDIPIIRGTSRKLRRTAGWHPIRSLETSLADVLTHFRNQYTKEEFD